MSGEDLALVRTGQIDLPSGYSYADPEKITFPELDGLAEAVEGPPDSPLDKPDWTEKPWERCFNVGVRTAEEQLVGYGRLAVTLGTGGELSHLMVHPDHRHRGIGTAILMERMRIAGVLGVDSFQTSLARTNEIRHKYSELGFQDRGNGSMVRLYAPSLPA